MKQGIGGLEVVGISEDQVTWREDLPFVKVRY
jgi:hypothetical protein